MDLDVDSQVFGRREGAPVFPRLAGKRLRRGRLASARNSAAGPRRKTPSYLTSTSIGRATPRTVTHPSATPATSRRATRHCGDANGKGGVLAGVEHLVVQVAVDRLVSGPQAGCIEAEMGGRMGRVIGDRDHSLLQAVTRAESRDRRPWDGHFDVPPARWDVPEPGCRKFDAADVADEAGGVLAVVCRDHAVQYGDRRSTEHQAGWRMLSAIPPRQRSLHHVWSWPSQPVMSRIVALPLMLCWMLT